MTFLRMLYEVILGLVIYNSFTAFILLICIWSFFMFYFYFFCVLQYMHYNIYEKEMNSISE